GRPRDSNAENGGFPTYETAARSRSSPDRGAARRRSGGIRASDTGACAAGFRRRTPPPRGPARPAPASSPEPACYPGAAARAAGTRIRMQVFPFHSRGAGGTWRVLLGCAILYSFYVLHQQDSGEHIPVAKSAEM